MMQPVCCLCGEKIKSNEHYFIFRSGRSVCKKCGKRYAENKNSLAGVVRNTGGDKDS